MTNADLAGAKRMRKAIEDDADAAYWVTVCASKLIAEVEHLLDEVERLKGERDELQSEVERLESELADTEADARQAWREQRLDDQLLGTFS